jgi:hypothetical protein
LWQNAFKKSYSRKTDFLGTCHFFRHELKVGREKKMRATLEISMVSRYSRSVGGEVGGGVTVEIAVPILVVLRSIGVAR